MTTGDAVNNIQTYLIRIFGLPSGLNLLPGWSGACNLCCASAYSQTCFRSASDQACLWAFLATEPGALNGGFKGRIVARSPRKRYGGLE